MGDDVAQLVNWKTVPQRRGCNRKDTIAKTCVLNLPDTPLSRHGRQTVELDCRVSKLTFRF